MSGLVFVPVSTKRWHCVGGDFARLGIMRFAAISRPNKEDGSP
jgi:hypothetical protein